MEETNTNCTVKHQISSFERIKGRWYFTLNVKSENELIIKDVILKKRKEDRIFSVNFFILKDSQFKMKLSFEYNPSYLGDESDYWDFYLEVSVSGKKKRVRIGNPSYFVIKKINYRLHSSYFYGDSLIYPYITVKNRLSICIRHKTIYDNKVHLLKEKLAFIIYNMFKFYWDKKHIKLIYEKFSNTAQDNSYYLFKFCYGNHFKENIFYVINKHSNDARFLDEFKDRTLDFLSLKHLIYLLACDYFISSESKAHSYIWKEQRGLIKKDIGRKKHVFLQHGVLGLKKVDTVFKKGSPNGTNLFNVSAVHEINILKEHLKYKENEIILSGLPRWDYLVNKAKRHKQILILPTWRDYLDGVNSEDFKKSVFFTSYEKLINSEELHDFVAKNNLTIKFCIHPRMLKYLKNFSSSSEHIKVIQYGKEPINKMMMDSSLLVTDFSSVAWDMFIQKKPIIFFHFREENNPDSYIDLDRELIGDRCFSGKEVVQLLKFYANNNFKEKYQYVQRRSQYFGYLDRHNSLRVYKGIKSHEKQLKKPNFLSKLIQSDFIQGMKNKFDI
ncbi:CDP-glycerol glycerophosphotransferase family protein [Salinibacillus kushneri]|nr:CDP-glycerol glycerophosphotransferase family protein [Salinibacillus kushneri]